jgi:hypothetical protein
MATMGESEGRGDAENVDRGGAASHSADDGGAAADQHERKCPNEFRDCLFHVHGDLPPSDTVMMPDHIRPG